MEFHGCYRSIEVSCHCKSVFASVLFTSGLFFCAYNQNGSLLRVLVRLGLFRNSGYKMLLHGGETPNIEKQSNLSSQHTVGGFPKPGNHHGPSHLGDINGRNPWNLEGRALSALSRFGQNARMVSDPVWLSRVQHQHAIMGPPCNYFFNF